MSRRHAWRLLRCLHGFVSFARVLVPLATSSCAPPRELGDLALPDQLHVYSRSLHAEEQPAGEPIREGETGPAERTVPMTILPLARVADVVSAVMPVPESGPLESAVLLVTEATEPGARLLRPSRAAREPGLERDTRTGPMLTMGFATVVLTAAFFSTRATGAGGRTNPPRANPGRGQHG